MAVPNEVMEVLALATGTGALVKDPIAPSITFDLAGQSKPMPGFLVSLYPSYSQWGKIASNAFLLFMHWIFFFFVVF